MRLGIKIDYANVMLFAPGANVSAILESLDGMVLCREDGYGESRKFVPQARETVVDCFIVPNDSVTLPDGDAANPFLTSLQDSQKKVTELQTENYTLARRVKDLESKIQGLVGEGK